MKRPDISQVINLNKPGWFRITINPGTELPFAGGTFSERDDAGICPMYQIVTELPYRPATGDIRNPDCLRSVNKKSSVIMTAQYLPVIL